MSKFKKIQILRFHKSPIHEYLCERCGNFCRSCIYCDSPTKIVCLDPTTWKCIKCKREFRIGEIQEHDKHRKNKGVS
jgi:hypothetical protein